MSDCKTQESSDVTTFEEMYDFFLSGITDDMFMEYTKEDTMEILEELLLAALPYFEFPRNAELLDVDLQRKQFRCKLTVEEMRIIRSYMVVEWINYQLASIENVRQKYSGSDFKFTSQASHIDKLIKLRDTYVTEGYHLQRLYCRRKVSDTTGGYVSTFTRIMEPRQW